MALSAGDRVGSYQILVLVGRGGMGEVYRARDTRLGRDVAVKVLPAEYSADPDRLRRFEQEARAAAALNHPNIIAVYDIGAHEGAPYLVTELLDGATLRETLTGSALPARKAVDYSLQVVQGLAAAHEKGIVHRDLKPENLFVTADERVKILDFGLAKLTETAPAASSASLLPTGALDPAVRPHTLPGVVMGTVGYMAPEQVRGLAADYRADIFAFGAILYEMLAGRRAFRGETAMDTMTAILKEDPADPASLDKPFPSSLQRIVSRCLEKNPAARFQSTRDLAFALDGATTTSSAPASPAQQGEVPGRTDRATSRARERLFAGAALVFLLVTLGLAAWMLRPVPPPVVVRFSVAAPAGTRMAAFTLAPSGRRLAFVAAAPGKPSMVYVRSLDAVDAVPLPGTEGARNPFWSPDSTAIAFFADGKLKRIEAGGGSVRTICDADGARLWGDWSRDGVILFSTERTDPIQRVPADGGKPAPATTVTGRVGHLRPTFLPDGRHFLYLAAVASLDDRGAQVRRASLDSREDTLVLEPSGWARYVEPGHLVFVRDDELFAQRFDPASGALSGNAQVIGAVGTFFSAAMTNDSGFSVSSDVLSFRTHAPATNYELVWFTRSGQRLSSIGEPGAYRNLQLSPDGSRLALHDARGGRFDVWIVDLARGVRTRLSVDPAVGHGMPVWLPDGASIVTRGAAEAGIVRWPLAGGDVERLAVSVDPNSVSPDGRFLVYTTLNARTNRDVGVLPLAGDRKPFLLLSSGANEVHGQVSPDGRWIAYGSDEAGGNVTDVYIQRFPQGGQKFRVSTGGGDQVRWRRDGRELFFLSQNGRLMSVPIQLTPDLKVGTPAPLFNVSVPAGGGIGTNAHYDVTADGQRFIVASRIGADENPPITVVVNWQLTLTKPGTR